MSVYTEAKVRKLFRKSIISNNGIFELEQGETLTPAAKGFLSDHHIQIVYTNQNEKQGTLLKKSKEQLVVKLEDSAVYPLLFRLSKLYGCFLRSQRELYVAFQEEKCKQVGVFLSIIEKMIGHQVLEDISDYHSSFPDNTELEVIRVNKQLDQQGVLIDYQCSAWQLSCYEAYLEMVILRKDFQLMDQQGSDTFVCRVVQLLKSMEVLLWIVSNE